MNTLRICDCCGKPMKEGYVICGCEHACSMDCAISLFHGDKKAFLEELELADTDEGETYFTEWENYELD